MSTSKGHYYSVPHSLVRQAVDIRITHTTVEILHANQRVASHRRSSLKGRHTTLREHMPPSHQRYLEWTPSRLVQWAARIGPATSQVVQTILTSRPHPEQGFRSCLGIFRLGKSYSNDRLEAACSRALVIGGFSYKSVASILKTGLDQRPMPSEQNTSLPIDHDNIRGSHYYNNPTEEEEPC